MQRYQLIKKDARYYYFNNEAGEMVQSPIHCYDEGRISMPDHQRDEDGYLCLGQYVFLHIETRGNRTVVYPSHDVYDYHPKRTTAPHTTNTAQSELAQELRQRICRNLDTYTPSKLWSIEKFMHETFDNSPASVIQLAQLAGESLLPDESETIEYKSCEEALNKPEILATIGAFANHKGGKLTLGVADNKRIVGCEMLIERYGSMDKFSNMLRNFIKTQTNTNLYLGLSIEFEKSGTHTLCHILTPPSADVVLVKDELYVRSGNTSQRLTGDRMLDFIRSKYEKTIQ
jgi:hypothetical protein